MAMYALSVVPLIKKCQEALDSADEPSVLCEAVQVWFADDAASGGKMRTLRNLWDLLVTNGPSYGYFPKPSKTHLVVKSERQAAAARNFERTGIHLTKEGDSHTHEAGQHHLGAAVGSAEYVAAYLDQRITAWAKEVDRLSEVAATHPHACSLCWLRLWSLPSLDVFAAYYANSRRAYAAFEGSN